MTTWHIINAATDAILIVDDQRRTVCEITNEEGVTPEDDAHARLIAASPALLAACEECLDEMDRDPIDLSHVKAVLRAAINKATGV